MTGFIAGIILISQISVAGDGFRSVANETVPPLSGVVLFQPDDEMMVGPVRDRGGPNMLVSDDERHRPQNETSVAINPANPNHILGGCNDYRGEDTSGGYYVSFDGGRTWQDDILPGLDEFDAAGNPSVVISREGEAWFCGIHFNRDNDYGGIFVSHSEDGGLNWDDPSYLIVHRDGHNPPFEDKPYIAIDNTGGDYDGRLYVSWTRFGTGQIYFSYPNDGGDNWSEPLRLYADRGQGSVPVVNTDGELFVIWMDYSHNRLVGRCSTNGGESFGEIFAISDADRLPYNLEPTEFRVNSIPSVTIDLSNGEHSNRIYVAWADDRSEDADILMVWSDDDGDNWSEPLRINDDDFQNGIDQFFPWLAVDPITGVLYAVWYDRRLDEDNIMIDLFGVRWDGDGDLPENERLTSESFDPRIGRFNGRFIGDNNGIAALAGRAHPAWCDTRNNNQDIFWAAFEGDRHFEVIDGEREHRFTIEEMTINGEDPEEGDEIAVIDENGWVVGAVVIEDDPPYDLTATGDWVGYFNNRYDWGVMSWHAWDRSEFQELVCAPQILEGNHLLQDDGQTVLNLFNPPPDRQEIHLERRWNIASTRIYPVDLSPWKVFDSILDEAHLIGDENGGFIAPEWNYSNMHPFNPLEGYKIGLTEDEATLIVEGVQLDPQTPIPLTPGWNIIAYLPDYELDPWIGFESVLEDVSIIKDDLGRFFVPDWDFCNIPMLHPGEGFMLKSRSEEAFLVYPEPQDRRQAFQAPVGLRHFSQPVQTSSNMSVLIHDIDFKNAGISVNSDAGISMGEIAVVNPNGEVCGAAPLVGAPPWGLAVWGADSTMMDMTGFEAGDLLEFRLWSQEDNREYTLISNFVDGSPAYVRDGFSVVQLAVDESLIPKSAYVKLNYINPNPFNSVAEVAFTLQNHSSVKLKIYDLRGRLVKGWDLRQFTAGTHRITIDGKDITSGLYILSLAANGESCRHRIVIIR